MVWIFIFQSYLNGDKIIPLPASDKLPCPTDSPGIEENGAATLNDPLPQLPAFPRTNPSSAKVG